MFSALTPPSAPASVPPSIFALPFSELYLRRQYNTKQIPANQMLHFHFELVFRRNDNLSVFFYLGCHFSFGYFDSIYHRSIMESLLRNEGTSSDTNKDLRSSLCYYLSIIMILLCFIMSMISLGFCSYVRCDGDASFRRAPFRPSCTITTSRPGTTASSSLLAPPSTSIVTDSPSLAPERRFTATSPTPSSRVR